MIITGKTTGEHLQNVSCVLERLQQYGLRANLEKCEFFKNRISFCGHEIDSDGLHKTQEKTEVVLKAPEPTNTTELRSFLGIVNYCGRFMKNLSATLHPLHQLLQKDCKWQWNEECQNAFEEVKNMVTSKEVLTHYDPTLPLRVASNASPKGLGAVLSHVMADGSERPIAYASRSLNEAERNYAQIDKEALGIVWAVKRFHTYLFGRHFTMITDHQPLVSIFSPRKGISTTSAARLQRYALFLAGYDYAIEYKNTKRHGNADSLSRMPVETENETEVEELEAVSLLNLSQFETLPVTHDQVRRDTLRDLVLSSVYECVMSGWNPDNRNSKTEAYFTRKTELTVQQGCLLWGIRVRIPPRLRKRVLDELHSGHIGVVKMKALARSYTWWPGIDKEIESMTKSCNSCQNVKHAPPAAPIHPWEWPSQPWSRVYIDFAGPYLGSMFFVMVDANSKWPEVIQMKTTTSEKIIEVLRTIFARNGIPRQL
ncbi:uncharacterized protein K02A2.6-like [Pecten maximus]|uniref:uncharacterized protein K02A2.6-like n=1 Tax=Pecten maximus TaxID=6579 RepID=UPI0014589955|nr:uncharacterized protein K02A2.6-like [Pecten maximus]